MEKIHPENLKITKSKGLIYFSAIIILILFLLYIDYDNHQRIQGVEIVHAAYQDSTINLDLYNGSETHIKSLQIELMFPPKDYVGVCVWKDVNYYSDNILNINSIMNKSYFFEIEFKPDNLFKPLSTVNRTIDVGSILKTNSKCRNVNVFKAVGSWFIN